MKANRMWLFSDVLEKNKRVFKVPVQGTLPEQWT